MPVSLYHGSWWFAGGVRMDIRGREMYVHADYKILGKVLGVPGGMHEGFRKVGIAICLFGTLSAGPPKTHHIVRTRWTDTTPERLSSTTCRAP